MFEVDWTDYEGERVGQRRARKEVERESKERDGSNCQGTPSARMSRASDQNHMSILGSLARKKTSVNFSKRKEQEPTITKSTTEDTKMRHNPVDIAGAVSAAAAKLRNRSSATAENMPSTVSKTTPSRGPVTGMHRSWAESPDRSSKDSMFSKMTQLTIPTLGSQGSSTGQTQAAASIAFKNAQQSPAAEKKKKITQYGRPESLGSPRLSPEVRTMVSIGTPPIPIRPPPSHFPSSPEVDMPESALVDDWFTALHGPARGLPRPGPNGTIRRGNVLLPPNLRRPLPPTPIRPAARMNIRRPPPRASLTKFLAHDPDDWKPVGEWEKTSSICTQHSGSSVYSQADETASEGNARDSLSEIMEALRIREEALHSREPAAKRVKMLEKDEEKASPTTTWSANETREPSFPLHPLLRNGTIGHVRREASHAQETEKVETLDEKDEVKADLKVTVSAGTAGQVSLPLHPLLRGKNSGSTAPFVTTWI